MEGKGLCELIERVIRRQAEIAELAAAARSAQERYDRSTGALVAAYDDLRKALDDRPVIYRGHVVTRDSKGAVEIRQWKRAED